MTLAIRLIDSPDNKQFSCYAGHNYFVPERFERVGSLHSIVCPGCYFVLVGPTPEPPVLADLCTCGQALRSHGTTEANRFTCLGYPWSTGQQFFKRDRAMDALLKHVWAEAYARR